MYEILTPSVPFSQGDIVDNCPLFLLDADPLNSDSDAEPKRSRARVVVLTQACDIMQARTTRVVVAPVYKAVDLVDQGVLKSSVIRDQVRRGLVYGWYFLPAAPAPIDLPESIVNFRELHT